MLMKLASEPWVATADTCDQQPMLIMLGGVVVVLGGCSS